MSRDTLVEAQQLMDALNDEKRYTAAAIVSSLLGQIEALQRQLTGAVAQKSFMESAIKTYVPQIWDEIKRSLKDG